MIYFVGAGSGAPDLITIRGQKLLQSADGAITAGTALPSAGSCGRGDMMSPLLCPREMEGCPRKQEPRKKF